MLREYSLSSELEGTGLHDGVFVVHICISAKGMRATLTDWPEIDCVERQ